LRPTPYVASLRVYEPLSAFDPADQLRWSGIEATTNTNLDEQRLALRRAVFPESPALRPDGAHVLDIDGARYVCPWSTATRCWAAMEEFKTTLPSTVSSLFIPAGFEEVITSGIEFTDEKVPHILTQTWIIPPRWFSLFSADERVRGRDGQEAFTVVRTSIAHAKIRSEKSHAVVQTAFGNGQVEEEIAQLGDWLEMFHPQSYLELDYGGLAGYLELSLLAEGEDGLDADTSVEDVQSSLTGLASSDASTAGRGYERLVSRWRKVAAFEQAM
jgi:hypothetical protein